MSFVAGLWSGLRIFGKAGRREIDSLPDDYKIQVAEYLATTNEK